MDGEVEGNGGVADDPRWTRIVARDAGADGLFWYSVSTTGVYCRPGCPSRAANPANVAIHDTLADARATGFRPCLRCRPEGAGPAAARAAIVERACRTIAEADTPPSTTELAAGAGMSVGWFHRIFRAATGVTPKAYAAQRRAMRLRDALVPGAGEATVTAAAQAAGFGSNARLQAQADAVLGMAPDRYRRGGAGAVLRVSVEACTLGLLLVATTERGVAAMLIGDDEAVLRADLAARFPAARLVDGDPDHDMLVRRAIAQVDAPDVAHDLPLDIRGTAFQQRVWAALRAIPAGSTASYAGIAAAIGAPRSKRAVAAACAANAHAVAIPCHRVVRTDGCLSGYRWGVARKRALLMREAGMGETKKRAGP